MASVLAVLAATVVFDAFTSPVPGRSPAPVAGSPAGLTGTLVWAEGDGHGRARLSSWDLATGGFRQGPMIGEPDALVDASTIGRGALGVISAMPDGSSRATLYRGLASGQPAEPLIRGAVVSWQSGATHVIAVRSAQARDTCAQRSSILSLDLISGTRTHELDVCGAVPAIARAGATTFFTHRSAGRARIDYVGFHRVHTVLEGYRLLGVSFASDLIVTKPGSQGVGLFWQGNLGAPEPFSVAAVPLRVDRVLAWSPDASIALVQGALGARSGVWALHLGAGPEGVPREPVLVTQTDGAAWATYALDGTAFILTRGQVRAYDGDGLRSLEPPPGAPTPSGPVVWLP